MTIAEENPTAADEILDVIQATTKLLGAQPEMGRVRPELADGLLVVRVLHHARDIDAEYFS